jgi:hypothetical protein
MEPFKRGLHKRAFDALQAMADQSGSNWWKDLLGLWTPSGSANAARPLRLAIRCNYLNFYFKGQSVAKVCFDQRCSSYVRVHLKYVMGKKAPQGYAKLAGTDVSYAGSPCATYRGLSTLQAWIEAASTHVDDEKTFVEDVVARSTSVIDLEMGLPSLLTRDERRRLRETEEGKGSGAPRVDAISVESRAGIPHIAFWEVKLVDDGRLVSTNVPEVVGQIKKYNDYFSDEARKADVRRAYAQTCQDMTKLLAMAEALVPLGRRLSPEVQAVADKPDSLAIDARLRLLIYEHGHMTASWPDHLKRLKEEFCLSCFPMRAAGDLAGLCP